LHAQHWIRVYAHRQSDGENAPNSFLSISVAGEIWVHASIDALRASMGFRQKAKVRKACHGLDRAGRDAMVSSVLGKQSRASADVDLHEVDTPVL